MGCLDEAAGVRRNASSLDQPGPRQRVERDVCVARVAHTRGCAEDARGEDEPCPEADRGACRRERRPTGLDVWVGAARTWPSGPVLGDPSLEVAGRADPEPHRLGSLCEVPDRDIDRAFMVIERNLAFVNQALGDALVDVNREVGS